MGNSVPQHGEKYADFCTRTNWQEANPKKHQQITKMLGRFDETRGAIICYDESQFNIKQINFFASMASEFIKLEIDFNWYFSTRTVCHVSNQLQEELNKLDIADRDNLFDTANFKTITSEKNLQLGGWLVPDNIKYTFENSRWYVCKKNKICSERNDFLVKLAAAGFALNLISTSDSNCRESFWIFYCTPQQLYKFRMGGNIHLTENQVEKLVLITAKP